ncbi:MAG TPA: SDR family oxidoreductase [Opitutaceae bacterium]
MAILVIQDRVVPGVVSYQTPANVPGGIRYGSLDANFTEGREGTVSTVVLTSEQKFTFQVNAPAAGSGSVMSTATFGYGGPNVRTIILQATDGDGAADFALASVAVANAPPTADAGGPYSVSEGGSVMLDAGGSFDPAGALDPLTLAQKSGSIVIVSSTHALAGRATMPLYDATKAAVLSLTRSLAIAHGKDGIRANAVCPGYTITEFHEARAAARGETPAQLRAAASGYGLLGRAAEPAEFASAIHFLASEEASNITGQALMVDGGISIVSR